MLKNYYEIHGFYDKVFDDLGIELAELDWIMCEILGKKRSQLPLCGNFLESEYKEIETAISERLKLKPLGYIFGKSEFFGRCFYVSRDVLIPRMDTEVLIENAKDLILKQKENVIDVSILDIGTGSGAIAITLQLETGARMTASDVSFEALEIARKNADNFGCEIEFVESDVFKNLKNRKYDIIISNPPYIESKVIEGLRPEVKNFEPLLALDGGADGLKFYREIIKEAPKHLNENGIIIFEIGYDQANFIVELLGAEFFNIKTIKDYGGNDRVVIARLRRGLW